GFSDEVRVGAPPHAASSAAVATAAAQPATLGPNHIQCPFLMETAMSDFLDQYPMLIFALEAFLALALLIFIVVWTASGRKKHARSNDRQPR
ncbi:putative transmembrane protein, partial [Burkholderia sp. TJI49]